MKRIWIVLLIAACLLPALPTVSVSAYVPYNTWGYTEDNAPIWLQNTYLPEAVIGQNLYTPGENGENVKVNGLSNPADLFIDADDALYVADRGNNRVVKIDDQGQLLLSVGEGELKGPEGVYVADNGDIYVADTGNARIVVFDANGNFLRDMGKPEDVRLRNIMFIPIKLSMDLRGYVYVLLKGGNEGMLILTPEGQFKGFFGRNQTDLSLVERVKRFFYTEEQIRTNPNMISPSVSGLSIGKDYFIYTCTQNVKKGQIKKYNANGEDLLLDKEIKVDSAWFLPLSITNLTVNEDGVIFAVDKANGSVFLYDNNGDALLSFGSKMRDNDTRIGVFGEPVGIAVDSRNYVFVADSVNSGIHVFSPTSFMNDIFKAVSLFNDGRFSEAEPYWEAILRQNVYFRKANIGLGKIAYQQGDWIGSMAQMKKGYNQEYYSDALWQQRVVVVQQGFRPFLLAVIGIFAAWLLLRTVLRRTGWVAQGRQQAAIVTEKLPQPLTHLGGQLRYAFQMLRHPVDCIYDITYNGKGGTLSALIILLLYYTAVLLSLAVTNFVFNKNGIVGLDILRFAAFDMLPIIAWILAAYLVGSITKGQGSLRSVFVASVYALIPRMVFLVPLAVMSLGLTLAEKAIYWFLYVLLWVWCGALLFTGVKEVQGYDLGETCKNVLWILFAAVMIVFFGAAIVGISMQSFAFIDEFIRELIGYV